MKKGFVLPLLAGLIAASAAQADSGGTIIFNGALSDSTCNVSVNGQGPNATVVLPTLSVTQLDAAGKTGGQTRFTMALTDCIGFIKKASAFFEAGDSVDLATGRLKNTTGHARNVDLQLLDGSSPTLAPIMVGDSSQVNNTEYVSLTTGSANLPYIVRYYATAPTVAGTVVSNVVYSLQYK